MGYLQEPGQLKCPHLLRLTLWGPWGKNWGKTFQGDRLEGEEALRGPGRHTLSLLIISSRTRVWGQEWGRSAVYSQPSISQRNRSVHDLGKQVHVP